MMPRLWAARPSSGGSSGADRTNASLVHTRQQSSVFATRPNALPSSSRRAESDGCRPPRSQVVIVMAAFALALAMLLGVVALCGMLRSESPRPHSHSLQPALTSLGPALTSLGSELTVSVNQSYVVNGPSKTCPRAFGDAVLPQSPATAVAALGVVAAVVAVAGWLVPHVVPAGRDPPRGPAAFLTGQELLTRFCLARR